MRTPLNGVLGMAELLADTPLAADQRAYLSALQECGRHLLGLVNDVLDLARLDAGEFTLHPAPVEPRQLLQSVAELLSPRATAKGLEIAWTAPANLPPVMADEGRIRQILFNLAGNAVKFTDRGGVLLRVERRGTGAQTRLRFCVTDTGPGVPEAERERIFEPFVQAHGDQIRADSAGLGLAIVRRLTAAHAGLVGIECPPEGGSRFYFEAEFDAGWPAPARTRRPLAGRIVVVVSPNPVVREAAAGLIEAAGAASFGFLGSWPRRWRRRRADAVALVDHALAGTGRRGLLKPLGGRPSVVLLAPDERARIPAYRKAGFEGYLIKPLREVSLVERVLAASGAAAARAEPIDDERADNRASRGARVLLVEDNPINALLARSLLEREGCAVDRAVGGHEALKAAAMQTYDLILMDLRMPDLDGIGATRALRSEGVRTPIIALTADVFEEDRRACLAAGMDDFLVKPLAQGSLQTALRRWVGGRWTPAKPRAKLAS